MRPPEARIMGMALRHMGSLLAEVGIAAPETSANVNEAATALMRQGNKTAWTYQLDLARPIVFAPVQHPKHGLIHPRIGAYISVKESADSHPPFEVLKLSLEITNKGGEKVQRWHVDRANMANQKYQEGPLYHLQMGGHWRGGDRSLEVDLEEPRWCHPPLDVVLLAEVVVANFYPKEWRVLHAKETWCNLVQMSQKLCFTDYVKKISGMMNVGQSTALAEMWAEAWAGGISA
jgi:hypothetical protein